MRPKGAALYLRVSTGEQTTENQRLALDAVAAQRGWNIVATYHDNGINGSKGRDRRPGLDAMLKDAVRGQFDVALVWSVDRLGRSLEDLLAILRELRAVGVDLVIHQQAFDTTTPAGKAMFQMFGVFAEFEKAMIVARVREGVARVKAGAPTKSGKAIGRPRVAPKIAQQIRERLAARATAS